MKLRNRKTGEIIDLDEWTVYTDAGCRTLRRGGRMRELKFRVWDKDVAKYVDGVGELYVDILEVGTRVFRIEQMCPGRYTIEQCTGLKDKNGKEIYEGDIVRWSFKVDRNSELTYTADAVKWETYAEEEWPYSTISGFTLPESEDEYEVIGNIHENPKLLEEEE